MPEPVAGDRISPDIILVRPLIQGGMGTVWVARHERLKSEVAVKLLSANFAGDETARKRFAREAASAMEVQSPHVVQMLDYGISDRGTPFLVMELLTGEDLEALLTKGRLAPRDALSIVSQIGRALHRAHERDILHRDVKPANVFLVASDGFTHEKYLVKLVDFGFAKRVGSLTAPLTAEGMIVGTPQYMSPEQMMGRPLDPRSDLFSLGSVAFEAFTGKRAFPGESLQAIADAIQKRPIPTLTHVDPSLPRGLDGWFAKACARDRDDRFASAREMITALEQAFSEPSAASDDEPAPAARVVRRSSALGSVVALAILLVVAGAIAWFYR